MVEMLINLKDALVSFLREEWFWAIVAVFVTLVSFIVQMKKENQISRANFVYNISNDFGNNDRILRVYQWLEKCRRENSSADSYGDLQISTDIDIYDDDRKEAALDFIDIDTYVNHFEVVYVILRSVNIKNIDELFQQRFLSFMLNPYIQKEELFACFLPDENDFLLMKKWLRSIDSRNRFSCEGFIDYMNTFTCGNYELTKEALAVTRKTWPLLYRWKVRHFLINYVWYLCDPACRYGFYRFSRNGDRESKVLRIIRSGPADKDAILALQERVVAAMAAPQWYLPSTEQELTAALEKPEDFACLQICNGKQVVAFAMVNLNPTPQLDLYLDLKANGLPYTQKDHCIFDTVFVDPAYRGFGMQGLLIDILCSWAATRGKRHIAATVHPENRFSADNFLKNGFALANPTPLPKYGAVRNFYTKPLSRRDARRADGEYSVYPYA